MKRGWILTLLLAVVAFTSVGMWGDVQDAGPALKAFPWRLLPAIAVSGFCCDLIRFFRWHLYLRTMGYAVPWPRSLNVFVSGLSMSATPGKVGFLIKGQMLKNLTGRTLIASSPIVIAELYMDFLGLSLISILGLKYLDAASSWTLALCTVPLLGLIPAVPGAMVGLLARVPLLSRRAGEMRAALEDMFKLFGPRVLTLAMLVTLVAWTSEGVALSLILRGLGFEMGVLEATVIFGFSTLVGALSMLPGGLVVTDSSLMGLIVRSGVPATPAALAAIMGRLFTLWLAVSVGSVFLVANRAHVYGRPAAGGAGEA